MNDGILPDEVEDLFAALLDLDPSQRDAHLVAQTAERPTLRAFVRRLLMRHAEMEQVDFMARPPAPAPGPTTRAAMGPRADHEFLGPSDSLDDGAWIGPYRICRVLGSGGMGTVYLAERGGESGEGHGAADRRVAIKVIREGMDAQRLMDRLRSERRVLARLDHPAFPTLIDAGRIDGAHGRGWPFIVMPHIDGLSITEHADHARMSIEARLDLIVSVCRAVAHAHEAGVLHLDLKPSNILIGTRLAGHESRSDALPQPTIIDFGASQMDESEATAPGQVRAGTPAYMAPEQHLDGDVDGRADVYAIGVILHELLLEERPKVLVEPARSGISPLLETWERLTEARRTTLAQKRGVTSATALETWVTGGVDRVVATALAHSPADRYATPDELADDIERVRSHNTPRGAVSVEDDSSRGERLARRAVTAAERERDDAKRHGYLASLAAAEAAWRDGARAEAARRLAHAPPSLRGWEWHHLQARLADQSRCVLVGHEDWVVGVTVSADGATIASASRDKTVRLWAAHDGAPLATLRGHENLVHAVAFSPVVEIAQDLSRGRRGMESTGTAGDAHMESLLGSASWDGTVRIWETTTGRCASVLRGPGAWLASIVWSTDGEWIAAGSGDGTIRLWSRTGEQRLDLPGHRDVVYALAFSPDGTTLASGSADGTIRLWDTRDGRCQAVLRGHVDWVRALVYIDPTMLLSAGADRTIRRWSTVELRCDDSRREHEDRIYALALRDDGAAFASASGDGTVGVWSVAAGRRSSAGAKVSERSETMRARLHGHESRVFSVATIPHCRERRRDGRDDRRDDRRDNGVSPGFVSGSEDGTLRVWSWNPSTPGCAVIATTESPVYALAIGASTEGAGDRLAVGTGERTVDLWGSETEAPIQAQIGAQIGAQSGVQIETRSSRITIARIGDPNSADVEVLEAKAHGGTARRVVALAACPKGDRMAIASDDGGLHLLPMRALVHDDSRSALGRALRIDAHRIDAHRGAALAVAWMPDGSSIVSAGTDRTIRIWCAATGVLRWTLRGHLDRVNAVAIAPDGRQLASAGNDGTLRVWDALDPERPPIVTRGHRGWVLAVAFSPDGSRVATGSADHSVRWWSARTGSPQAVGHGHTTWVTSVAFSPDGSRLASGAWDRTVRIWDPDSGDSLVTLRGHDDRVSAVGYGRDGATLFSGDWSGTVRAWRRDA